MIGTRIVDESRGISSLICGFRVIDVLDVKEIDEDGKESDVIEIRLANDNHVAVDLLISENGLFVSESYAIGDDFVPITQDKE